jgi:hypothetical protein
VLVVQFGLIFWLGKPQPIPPQFTDLAPSLQLVGPDANQVLGLTDPTLFALPHREGFSGAAWLSMPVQQFQPYLWSEPSRWLALAQDRLGADFESAMATNQLNALPVYAQPDLELKRPSVTESLSFPTRSTLRLMGDLARRRLLVRPTLPSWPSADILTNTVVQVLVAADGKPVSATILDKKSGSLAADQQALRDALNARFEPLDVTDPANPLAGLSLGQMVFEWHTLPLPATNNEVAPAPPK